MFRSLKLSSFISSLRRSLLLPVPETRPLSRIRYLSTLKPSARVLWSADTSRRTANEQDIQDDSKVATVCCGCGSILQSSDPKRRGYIPEENWKNPGKTPQTVQDKREVDEENIEDYFPETPELKKKAHSISLKTCQRCFSLKNYNNALHITLKSDDYLKYLSSLKNREALMALVIDVTDFPSCVFPKLDDILSSRSSVLIIANKTDLLPNKLPDNFYVNLEAHIIKEIGIRERNIVGTRFVSAKKGTGIPGLANEIQRKWGNRGDVYLLGSTNVGKSSLFNKLLVQLCGAKPGELNADTNLLAPKATISLWPGTTLGLLSFPMLSVGKRRRFMNQLMKKGEDVSMGLHSKYEEQDFEDYDLLKDHDITKDYYPQLEEERLLKNPNHVEVEDMFDELGIRKRRRKIEVADNHSNQSPKNRQWLHDTPGAINEAQLINYLTTKELTLGLPKAPLQPKTFILRPGQSIFLGGLARLDYIDGSVSAYFTVFSWPYLRLHATKTENAVQLYERHFATPDSYFMLPIHQENRCSPFPPLGHQDVHVRGVGWKRSAADIVLSSAGWVAVTFGGQDVVTLRAHTPNGKGICIREPSLVDEAVNMKGRRERHGNKCAYKGRK